MVVGNGLIAKRFEKYAGDDHFLVFASGVSNSKSTDQNEYLREFTLLKECLENNSDKVLVYFSTSSVFDPAERSSAYISHKLKMERFIEDNAGSYVIFRISNLAGRTPNPNTVLNYFTNCINSGIPFNLWANAERNIIDIDDVYGIADYILGKKLYLNSIVNIANPVSYSVKKIVETIEQVFNKKGNYELVPRGSGFSIDVTEIKEIISVLNINFGGAYLEGLLHKYYTGNEL